MGWKNLPLWLKVGIYGLLIGLISNVTLNRIGYIFYRSDINKNIFLNLVGFYSILVLPIIGVIIGLIISKSKKRKNAI